MKKLISFVLTAVSIICVCSCGNQSSSDLQAKVDSLQTALSQRDADYRTLDEFVNVISTGLDSIAIQETELFNPSKESPTPSQEQIKKQLSHFKETLQSQRERIAELEKKLGNSEGNGKKLQRIVIAMKAQLEEKESQIAALQEEVNNNNVTINDLRSRIIRVTQENVAQRATIDTQNQTIMDQDDQLHEAYLIIGKKAELKDAGVLKGGFLKKSKVDVNTLDKRMFKTIDVRSVKEIAINAKKPEVLSQMPADSYTIEQKGNSSVLRITNVNRFWSITKYLIIQTD